MLVRNLRVSVWHGICSCSATVTSHHKNSRLALGHVTTATRTLSFNSLNPSSWFKSPADSSTLLDADEFSEIPVSEVLSTAAAEQDTVVTLTELGLGSPYWPIGWVQRLLDMMHNDLGLEWWQTIVALSVVVNTALLPLTIHWRNPRVAGSLPDAIEAARNTIRVRWRPNKKQMNGLVAISYAAIASSYFFGIRGMATAPVPGWQTGGILWFPDLAAPDPALAIITGLTIMSGLPIMSGGQSISIWHCIQCGIAATFVSFQPSALGLFWCCSNTYSVVVSLICKSNSVQRFLGFHPHKRSTTVMYKESTAPNVESKRRERTKHNNHSYNRKSLDTHLHNN